MNRRLAGLMRKEFIQFFRDKVLVILILYTFVEIAICGWALTLEVRNMPTAVYDGDRSAESKHDTVRDRRGGDRLAGQHHHQ